jgi:hypothetical protein
MTMLYVIAKVECNHKDDHVQGCTLDKYTYVCMFRKQTLKLELVQSMACTREWCRGVSEIAAQTEPW